MTKRRTAGSRSEAKNRDAFSKREERASLERLPVLNEKAYDFLEMILQCRVKGVEDAALLEFKLYGVDELSKQAENHPDIQERLFENHIDVMMEVVDLKRDYDGYLVLPAFFERIKAQDCPNERMEGTLDELKRLLNYCFIKDNIPAFYTLLKEIREALSSTQQQQRES